jgi:hypothetical protein
VSCGYLYTYRTTCSLFSSFDRLNHNILVPRGQDHPEEIGLVPDRLGLQCPPEQGPTERNVRFLDTKYPWSVEIRLEIWVDRFSMDLLVSVEADGMQDCIVLHHCC